MNNKTLHLDDTHLITQDNSLDEFPLVKEVDISVEQAKNDFLMGKLGNTEVGKNQIW